VAGALREVAAAFGIQFDTGALTKGDAAVKSVTARIKSLGKEFDALRVREAQAALAKALGAKNVDALAVKKAELNLSQAQLEIEKKTAEEAAEATARRGVQIAGATALVFAAAAAVRAFASAILAEAHEITSTSAALRVKAQYLQEVRGAFQLAGLSAEEASATFATFRRNTMGTRQTLDTVIARLERVTSPAARARLAVQYFGEQGRRLLPVLHAGAGGLAELRKEFQELGGGLSDEAIAGARGLELGLTRFRFAGDAVRSQLAAGLLPALTMLVDAARGVTSWVARMLRGTEAVRNVFYLLGAVATALAIKLLLPFLPAAIAVAALVLVVDDLVTMFRGGRSVIGGFIDDLFGVGSAAAVVRTLGAAFEWVEQKALAAGLAIEHALERLGILQSATDRRNQSDAATRASFQRTEADRRARVAAAAARAQLPAGARRASAPAASGTVPVPVPALARAPVQVSRTVVHSRPTQIHIHGATDVPHVVRRVREELRAEARDRADAAHPLPPRDEAEE
jgi:hypothetical protein